MSGGRASVKDCAVECRPSRTKDRYRDFISVLSPVPSCAVLSCGEMIPQ